MTQDIFINHKLWKTFDEETLENYIQSVFKYYRATGFPFFPTDRKWRDKEWKKLQNYDYVKCIDGENKIIKQTMHGLALAWSYMPHSWKVVCNDKNTPWDVFHDDELLMKCIRKRVDFGANMSNNGLRKMMKMFTNTQCVSNFRPTAAASIYRVFSGIDGDVWDMSCGFGGRLLGSSMKPFEFRYIGTDPSTQTYDGLCQMRDDFNINALLYNCGSEDFTPDANSLEFCFTSPPYFDLEKYSDEETQSYIKFPEKEAWLNGFLKKTFENCYRGLKPNCYMAVNVANTKDFKDFEEQTVRVALEAGFEQTNTWKLALSNPTMNSEKDAWKYEPIFTFKK